MIRIEIIEDAGNVVVFTPSDHGTTIIESLVPGQFDRARKILPDHLYAEVEELWTPEVIKAWEDANPVEEVPQSMPENYKPSPTIGDIQDQLTQLQLAVINLGSDDSAIHASLVDKGEILLSDVPKMIRNEVQSTLSAKSLFNA